jgi:hypothetical protein
MGASTSTISNRSDLRISHFRYDRALSSLKKEKQKKKEEMEAIEQMAIPHKINFENAKSALDQRIKPGFFHFSPPQDRLGRSESDSCG